MIFTRKRPTPAPVVVPTQPPSRARAAWSDGLGLIAIRSVQIIAIVLLAAVFYIAMSLLADLISVAFNPRLRGAQR